MTASDDTGARAQGPAPCGERELRFKETAILTQRIAVLQARADRLEQALAACRSDLGDCKFRIEKARARNETLGSMLKRETDSLAQMKASLSWRVTAPLRRIRAMFAKGR